MSETTALWRVKVGEDGSLQVPAEIVRRAGLRPGDAYLLVALSPGHLVVRPWPSMGPEELRERYPITRPVAEEVVTQKPSVTDEAPVGTARA